MKQIVFFVALVAACCSTSLIAQRGNAEVSIGGTEISIEYGRPALQGRDMLSRLPEGMAWRMGMNDATVLKTSGTLLFGDKQVQPGSYRLWARKVAGGTWEMMISSDMGNYSDSSAVAIVPLKTGKVDSVEKLTIELEAAGPKKGMFTMTWASLKVTTGFSVK